MVKIRKAISNALLTLVIIASLIVMAVMITPRVIGYTICGMEDNNMAPQYPKGSLVVAEKVMFKDIKVGDVLVFADKNSSGCFTTRIVEIREEKRQFVTKSDASKYPDPMTTGFGVCEGRAAYSLPYFGYIPIFVNSFVGKVVLALLYIIWISVEVELARKAKRRDGKK